MGEVVVLTAGAGEVRIPGIRVALACAGVEELLVAAAAGAADAVLVGAALPGLDRQVVARLTASGTAVVGLADDEVAERRMRQLGIAQVRPSRSADLGDVVSAAVAALPGVSPHGFAHAAAPATVAPSAARPGARETARGSGRVLAVWGPTGAPGRTTVAVGLAAELAALGWPVLVVDADPYGGAAAVHLGVPDEASGLAAACRAANLGVLDTASLATLVARSGAGLGLLSGVVADRWPELRPTALEVVLELARWLAAVTVVDVGFCLEQDEELSYDTIAPRRNGATLTALAHADVVVAVGGADPVGMPRLVRALDDLGKALPGVTPLVVVNRVRSAAAESGARDSLRRLTGLEHLTAVPEDGAACDAALRAGLPLTRSAPQSPARLALRGLAQSLVG